MDSHHEEKAECPCPCHASGSICSVCASTEGRMKGGMTDPTEMGFIMWQKAFFKANMELMVEKLKKRMESRWGPATDKEHDALIEKMEKQWMAMFQQTGAEEEFRKKLAKIYTEGQK